MALVKQHIPDPVIAGAHMAKPSEADDKIPDIIYDKVHNKTYNRLRFLGKGGFARCYEVEERKTKDLFACKVVSKTLLVKQHQREKMAQEISIHRDLKHEFVVKFYSYFEDDINVYILLELCTKKSLMEMQKRRRVLCETEVRYFLRQIMKAVEYLHGSKIIHRDLKLGNIFISEDMKLKVGDFGLATTLEFLGERKKTLCGTPNYIAPEVLNKKGHSFEVDIWSVGCILYTLLVGRPPFETTSLKDTYSKIKRGDYMFPQMKISSGMRNLIQKMLMVEPALRPTAKEVLNNEYLTKSFIPRVMPVSALTLPPRFDRDKENVVVIPNGQKRPLLDHNPKSPIAVGPNGVLTQGKMQDLGSAMKAQAASYMKTLLRQMKGIVSTKPSEKGLRNDDISEDPNCAPMLWVAKWVDYSDKYGFGYQLSDDSIGVSFNDISKMILLADGKNLQYVDKAGNEHYHTKDEYPVELSKKVKLLNYFQQYMVENLLKAGGNIAMGETAAMTRLPSMWTWFRTSRAVVMVLSNGTLQINNFKDHTKTILCPLMGAITTLDHNKPMRTFKFSSIETNGCTESLYRKIEYAVDKLEVILNTTKDQLPKPLVAVAGVAANDGGVAKRIAVAKNQE